MAEERRSWTKVSRVAPPNNDERRRSGREARLQSVSASRSVKKHVVSYHRGFETIEIETGERDESFDLDANPRILFYDEGNTGCCRKLRREPARRSRLNEVGLKEVLNRREGKERARRW